MPWICNGNSRYWLEDDEVEAAAMREAHRGRRGVFTKLDKKAAKKRADREEFERTCNLIDYINGDRNSPR
jgi:hypothetical protein